MSAERPRQKGSEVDKPKTDGAGEEESELDRKLAAYARIGLPIATLGAALVAGNLQGPPAAVLVLAGGTLIGVIALLWASVRTLVGETPLSGADAYAMGAPRAEEEQKRAVLRALKDLDFEHAVGKISDEDYRELSAKYRAEAKRLLRQLDEEAEPRRAQIEAMVNKRLRREGLLEGGDVGEAEADTDMDAEEPEPSPPADEGTKGKKRKKQKGRVRAEAESTAEAPEVTRVCPSCETVNDSDALFCKKCGKRQESKVATEPAGGGEATASATPKDGEEAS